MRMRLLCGVYMRYAMVVAMRYCVVRYEAVVLIDYDVGGG